MTTKLDREKMGAAQAAILAAMLGTLTIGVVNLGTEISNSFKTWVHTVGKAWMPGAEGIGPYSGKETLALIVWLGSWFLLHLLLKKKEWNQNGVMAIFLAGVATATTLVWPPVFHFLAGKL